MSTEIEEEKEDCIYSCYSAKDAWNTWSKCQSDWKWFSFIPLILAQIMYSIGITFYFISKNLYYTETCCNETGKARGKTVTTTVGEGVDNKRSERVHGKRLFYKIIALTIVIYTAILVSIMCLLFAYSMFLVSGIFCYPNVNENVQTLYYVLDQTYLKTISNPTPLKIHKEMNAKSLVVGEIALNQIFYGQLVYPGWFKLAPNPIVTLEEGKLPEPELPKLNCWVNYQLLGKKIIWKEFETNDKAQDYLLNFVSDTIPSIPIAIPILETQENLGTLSSIHGEMLTNVNK